MQGVGLSSGRLWLLPIVFLVSSTKRASLSLDRIALVGALEAYSNVKTDLEPLSLSIQQKALPTDHARLQAVPGGKRIAASERRRVEQSEANSVCEM